MEENKENRTVLKEIHDRWTNADWFKIWSGRGIKSDDREKIRAKN